jgi:hypothetical protein
MSSTTRSIRVVDDEIELAKMFKSILDNYSLRDVWVLTAVFMNYPNFLRIVLLY